MWADVHHTQNNSQTWSDESLPRCMVWRSLWTKRYGVSRGVVKKKMGGFGEPEPFVHGRWPSLLKLNWRVWHILRDRNHLRNDCMNATVHMNGVRREIATWDRVRKHR